MDKNPTKICPQCQSEISALAKKCPHCQSDQRNFFKRHPIVSVLLLIAGVGLITSIISTSGSTPVNTTVVTVPIPEATINSLRKDLTSFGQGRWQDVVVGQSEYNELIVRAYALPGANKVAINSYCEVLKEEVSKYSITKANLYIYQFGEVVKACL
jgi:hypothetical protein